MKLHYFIVLLSNLLFIDTYTSNFSTARSSTDLTVYQEMSANLTDSAPAQLLQSTFKTRTSSDIDSDNSAALAQSAHIQLPNNNLIPSFAQIVPVPVPVNQTETREKLSAKTQIAFGVLAAVSLFRFGLGISYFANYYSRPHTVEDNSSLLIMELTSDIISNGLLCLLYKMHEDRFY